MNIIEVVKELSKNEDKKAFLVERDEFDNVVSKREVWIERKYGSIKLDFPSENCQIYGEDDVLGHQEVLSNNYEVETDEEMKIRKHKDEERQKLLEEKARIEKQLESL